MFLGVLESKIQVFSSRLFEPEVFTKEPVTKHWFLDFLFFSWKFENRGYIATPIIWKFWEAAGRGVVDTRYDNRRVPFFHSKNRPHSDGKPCVRTLLGTFRWERTLPRGGTGHSKK
jgi:hypothetical protein